eukprot:TRINITY_DN13470_c0_g1_i2.p1 TRINITY_DN13470_c0_g1~~TRINITY_DN13470_c0_g1_i2.p1  ORF type:complete len:273 (-),score=70.69 TRINITY_DN13470_c0_g1_i2:9-827(-)
MCIRDRYQRRVHGYRNKRFIESYLTTRYNKEALGDRYQHSFQSLDVTLVIRFEDLNTKLLKAIEKSANEHIEFWRQLDSLIPDLNSLHKLGLSTTTSSKDADDVWRQLVRINPNHQKALRIYGHYLKDIRNDEEAAGELLERLKGESKSVQGKLNDFEVMFAEDTTIVVMNAGDKETRGKIARTNVGIVSLFKYSPAEVIGQDVSILMPHIIGIHHDYFLEKYFKSGRETLVNNERELYAMQRAGSLICLSLIHICRCRRLLTCRSRWSACH